MFISTDIIKFPINRIAAQLIVPLKSQFSNYKKCYTFFYILTFFCLANINLTAQKVSSELAFYADVLTNASSADHRFYANNEFKTRLNKSLSNPNSFGESMTEIPWIFVKYDEKRSFRLISWQLEKQNSIFEYFSIYQKADGDYQYFEGDVIQIEEREKYSLDHSYTAIIHSISSFEDYFLLSAYRQNGTYNAQKICEVLSFENGEPVLGKAIFNKDENTLAGRGKKRVVMNYSPVAKPVININTAEGIIVFDHIISIPSRNPDEGMLQIPDGSYQAYEYSPDGKWIFNEKLYTEFQETPLNKPLKSKSQVSKKGSIKKQKK